ncbi:MAG: hypothetical protein LCH67_12440 [Bacteroidetes bacterium]|nr:hypothetical protein [Bacteroidota bacterium]
METTINLNANIPLTVNQLVELAIQLPKKDRIQLASLLIENENFVSKNDLLLKIKEGLEDVKLHQQGEIKLRTLDEFLADI